MTTLSENKCVACRADSPRVSKDEVKELIHEIPDWQIVHYDNIMQLEKVYSFTNFMSALDFTNKVGKIAEEQDHHPALLTEWGKVTVKWWSHVINGLHLNDFVMAAKTDEVYKSNKV